MAEERWATAVAKIGERAIVFRYVVAFAAGFDQSTQPDRIIIQWKYHSDSGMPSTAERQRMEQLEDLLTPKVEAGGSSTLTLVSTGENLREWVYYTTTEAGYMARLNEALRGQPPFPIEIIRGHDPAWSTYQTFLGNVKK
jgi:Family of unknown function (DUF695)